ncbi:hypothetical protein [Spiroplasma endosymbiont of Cantharis nigra]|uniref:hypothetical protein n=1 Tax=Spiroplasma endosymbiont of Cantharis nigra TaxID=3066278 RepID=UPI0030D4A2D7
MVVGIVTALLILCFVFLILGLFIARKGDVWGIMMATIGFPIFGTVWAFCLYENKKNIEAEIKWKNLNENINFILLELNNKD